MEAPERLTDRGQLGSWVRRVHASDHFRVEPRPLARSRAWSQRDGEIRHVSGRFFGVVGLVWGDGPARRVQPFIEQREVGTLGFIARPAEDGLDLLVHAKSEPGNVGVVQLAPTCQATASNRDRVHGGGTPPYSGHFDAGPAEVVSDSLQSEQGTRFLGKRNRNVLVLDDRAEVEDDLHRWVPFALLRGLMAEDFLVNTDARSVLCCADWARLAGPGGPFAGDDPLSRDLRASFRAPARPAVLAAAVAALRERRERAPAVERCRLEEMPGWRFDAGDPTTITDGRLAVRHISVHADTREVADWDQPIVADGQGQRIDLDCGRVDGTLAFAFRPAWEPGLRAGAELAPTRSGTWDDGAAPGRVLLSARQSDEGGRFFQTVADYRIVDVGPSRAGGDLVWLTLAEVRALLPRGCFTNESRSALSLLLALV